MGFASAPDDRDRVAVLLDAIAEKETHDISSSGSATHAVIQALDELGYRPVTLPLEGERTADWIRALLQGDFVVAFNLCEGVGGEAAGEHLPAAVIELLDIPLTGASAATLLHCLHKARSSATLAAGGVPVPRWSLIDRTDGPDRVADDWDLFPAIVKPAAEDASNGVHAQSVTRSRDQLLETVDELLEDWPHLLVQQFIDGREINVAVVGEHVLPPSEIDFRNLPEGHPRIVSYNAKWDVDSPQYRGTRPVCPARLSSDLQSRVIRYALRAWGLMDGAGYGRVDVRVAPDGTPFVIDVNPNPDLSPDAGLARQAEAAGWSYRELIRRIVEEARSRDISEDRSTRRWIRLDAGVTGSPVP